MRIITWDLKKGDTVTVEHPSSGRQHIGKVTGDPYELNGVLWIQFTYGIEYYFAHFSEKYQQWYSGLETRGHEYSYMDFKRRRICND